VSEASHHLRQTQIMGMVAMATTTRLPIIDVPAASGFAADMARVVDHTKLWLHAARQRMIQQERNARKPAPFRPGQYVWLSIKNLKLQHGGGNKLQPRYVGPFQVDAVVGKVSFRLKLPFTMKVHNVFHASLLKPWKRREGQTLHPSPIFIDGEEEWEIERLCGRRVRKVATKKHKHAGPKRRYAVQYLVKWKGFDAAHNQWMNESELNHHARQLVESYEADNPR